MKKTVAPKNYKRNLAEIPRYDFGYQSVHFHLKQQQEKMIPTQIMMAVRINGRRYRLYTKHRVEPAFWDVGNECCRLDEFLSPRVRTRMAKINSILADIKKQLDLADLNAAEQDRFLAIEDLRAVIRANEPVSRHSKPSCPTKFVSTPLQILHQLADKFDSEISSRGTKGAASSRKTYLFGVQRLSEFINEMHYDLSDFSKLDRIFYQQFTKWLNERGAGTTHGKQYCSTTVHVSINCIRNLHSKAYLTGLTDVPSCPSRTQVPTPPSSKIYLTESELDRLRLHKASSSKQQKVLDMFILASYTALRISDVNMLGDAVISDDVIHLFQKKTHGYVSVPILKEVRDIVTRYQHCVEGWPRLNQGYANQVIKKMCKESGIVGIVPVKECRGGIVFVRNCPKYELVSFHTARRSCITNLFRRGYSPNYLMTMSGHKSISSFQRYVRSSTEELSSDFIKVLRDNDAM